MEALVVQTLRRPLDILLVEDNPGDIRLTREAMKDWSIPPRLNVVTDGMEALSLLRSPDGAESAPDLILLDLNLPRVSGREVLKEIKNSEEWRQIPVIVLSTSDSEDDVRAAYELHANCYVVKPAALDRYMEMVQGIEQFWGGKARLPGLAPQTY
jgi:two-component system, chemotaxis family, response regulator Rcp1